MDLHLTTSGQLGPYLKRLRTQQGLSQAALGRKLGLSQERISKIEANPESISLDQIMTVLMALDAALQVVPRRRSDESVADKVGW